MNQLYQHLNSSEVGGFRSLFRRELLLAELVLLMLFTGNQYIYTKCTVFKYS